MFQFLIQRWQDPHLQWDPIQFGGVNELFVARNKIWLPEIDIFYRYAANDIIFKIVSYQRDSDKVSPSFASWQWGGYHRS